MRLFGLDISRARRSSSVASPLAAPASPESGGWLSLIREPYPGAWQRNEEISAETALSYFAVFACITLIASDIAKLRLRLVSLDQYGIWNETSNPAYSPVLRRPNRYQSIVKLIEQWMTSKLVAGNAYALKQRDGRHVVEAMYVLDPRCVRPLVAPDGAVYYRLERNDLAGIPPAPLEDGHAIVVPASEVIHDRMITFGHPLIGVTPLYACGMSALQGQTIQTTSSRFFNGGASPGGVLVAPGAISEATAQRLKKYWEENFTGVNVGKVAVLGDGLKYEPMSVNAVDSQLIDQLKWTADTICSCYHVPPYMIGVGPPPPYANVEPLLQQYYSQCLQSLINSFEVELDHGLAVDEPVNGTQYGTELDIDDLIWMDTATKTKAASDSIGAGALSPDEARKKYFGLGPVAGGSTPYMQQQNYSLAALAARDAADPFAKPAPALPAVDDDEEDANAGGDEAKFLAALLEKTAPLKSVLLGVDRHG